MSEFGRAGLSRALGIAVSIAGVVLLYAGFVASATGRVLDQSAMVGRHAAMPPLIWVAGLVLGTITVASVAATLAGLIWWSYCRGAGLRHGIRSVVGVVGAAGSAEVLKLTLPATTGDGVTWSSVGSGSFPSGHATLAAALALALLETLDETGRRKFRGPLIAYAVAVAAATVMMGWHRPADALAGVLLAIAWHQLLRVRRRHESSSPIASAGHPGTVGGDARPSPFELLTFSVVALWVAATTLPVDVAGESSLEASSTRYAVAMAILLIMAGAGIQWSISSRPSANPEVGATDGTRDWQSHTFPSTSSEHVDAGEAKGVARA